MEVGAVKQAFNNELILLKKKLNQAKIHVIHKLTRKAKTLLEKKCAEKLKEKNKRKAGLAVNEVLILKKIKVKDIAKFTMTHSGNLKDYLNKPTVDQNKACARLLLHKCLQDKYTFLRSRFSNVPVENLLMSREESRKLKKEARDKQKNKKKGKENKNVTSAEGDWEVEDINESKNKTSELLLSDDVKESDDEFNDDKPEINMDNKNNEESEDDSNTVSDDEFNDDKEENVLYSNQNDESDNDSNVSDKDEIGDKESVEEQSDVDTGVSVTSPSDSKPSISSVKLSKLSVKSSFQSKFSKVNVDDKSNALIHMHKKKSDQLLKTKTEKKAKNINKGKNLNEKILNRNFKKIDAAPVLEKKIVDPFFITSSGENYMSVAEIRPPDEIKEEHRQGNRKLRRAAMFGHVPKFRPRQNNSFNSNNNKFNNQNNLHHNQNSFKDKAHSGNNERRSNFRGKDQFSVNNEEKLKPEKLHPSWEAKKKQSGILPFQGKKVVFNED